MAAGSPVSQKHGRATATRPGTVLKAATVAAPTATATSGTLPTANGSVTIANAASPTVAELLEYCTELRAKQAALISSLQTAGVLV